MADIKQRQAAANQAFFEQKAREYTRETGERWTAKDVADYFEGTVRELTNYGTDAKSVARAWEETAEYNGMNAPSADMYPNEDAVQGWNDYKSATSITRDAIQWGINSGFINGTPADLKSLNETIQRSFNNIDSLSALPPGFEEAVSTSNAMLGRTAAPTGGTLENLLSNTNKPNRPLNDVLPGYVAKGQQRMQPGRQPSTYEQTLKALQGIKSGTNMQRALNMLPQTDPADRIAAAQLKSSQESRNRSAKFDARFDRNQKVNDAIFAANMGLGPKFGGLPAMGKSSAIEQLQQQFAAGSAQRFAPSRPTAQPPVSLSTNRLDSLPTRTTDKRASGTTGFGKSSIPTMTPQGVYNVRGAGDGTVKAGFASTVPENINVASRSLAPSIAASGSVSRPSYAANLSGAGGLSAVPNVPVQQASVPARGPANTAGANSYFADPRVASYTPGQSTGLRSVGGKTVGNQFSGLPSVSYDAVPAAATSFAPGPSSDIGVRYATSNNALQNALNPVAASYSKGGPAIDVMPPAATRSVTSNSPPIDANIQPAPSYSVSVAPNGVSTATPVDPYSLQAGTNRNVSKVAELAAKVGPAIAGGIVAGPAGAAIGGLIQNAAQTFFGGQQARQAAQNTQASGGSVAAAPTGGIAANPSGLGTGPVSYSVDPRTGNREITNSYGVTSTVTPEGFTYGGPGGSSGKG